MTNRSFDHGRIISAFLRAVPDSFVRDYTDNNGYIVVARGYRNIKWGGQTTTTKVERSIPAVTLINLPRGTVRSATLYSGVRLVRPGWRTQFRKAMRHLTYNQMRRITKLLGEREVFPGVVV